ncbi:MAG: VOC family protein, partial [Tissierellia bacterium]|nr:VOC family protein [Tissierellia bacterium]
MKLGHLQYKVEDLHRGVEQFRDLGFTVEYGSGEDKSFNAIIWFEDGPFLELFSDDYLKSFKMKLMMRLAGMIGRKGLVERFKYYQTLPLGFCDLCLESKEDNLDKENEIIRDYFDFDKLKGRRKTASGDKLKWDLSIPRDIKFPFLMSAYNIPQKPNKINHSNGAKGFTKVRVKSRPEFFKLLNILVDDDILTIDEDLNT